MAKYLDVVDELLGMAQEPDQFSKGDLGDMILVAATEIIKLRGFGSLTTPFAKRPRNARLRNGRARSSIG
jgi:hypothetical protein